MREGVAAAFSFEDLLTTGRKIVFYGAGKYARAFLRRHCIDSRRIRLPDYICDQDSSRWGSDFLGVPVRPPTQLQAEREDGVIVIVTTCPFPVLGDVHTRLYYYDFLTAASLEMRFFLEDRAPDEPDRVRSLLVGEKSRRVFDAMTRGQAAGQIWFRDIFEPHPYFGNDVVPTLPDGEVLVDAGAYTGAHIEAFGRTNPSFRAVHAFEPHRGNFEVLAGRVGADPRVQLFSRGLYDRNGQVAFADDDALSAHVLAGDTGHGATTIDVVRLDDAVAGPVTYLKMDIEGAEANALAGSVRTIERYKPRLAICVYHRPQDYLDIPRQVLSIRSDYRLFLRQHSPFNIDTVLYAV